MNVQRRPLINIREVAVPKEFVLPDIRQQNPGGGNGNNGGASGGSAAPGGVGSRPTGNADAGNPASTGETASLRVAPRSWAGPVSNESIVPSRRQPVSGELSERLRVAPPSLKAVDAVFRGWDATGR